MKICEMYPSIQGESTYAGMPCFFVRVSGCNLRCVYCDTTYAYDDGTEMQVHEIMKSVRDHGLQLVEITGGEPLLQDEVHLLAGALLDSGYAVLIETNGSVSIRDVDRRATIIMDIKTPKSGMWERMDIDNLTHLKPSDELKFVISDRQDYEWVKRFIQEHSLEGRHAVLLSPAFDVLSPHDLCQWMVNDRLLYRLNLQLHKYIYGPEERGV